MKKRKNLLDKSSLLKIHPSFYDLLCGDAATMGKMIFAKRIELGWTQKELASKASIEYQMITVIEGGSVMLPENVYQKLYKVLEITKEEREEWIHVLLNEPPHHN